MAVTYIAARTINIAGHVYQAGDAVDTTGWNPNVISEYIRMGWLDASIGAASGNEIASSDITAATAIAATNTYYTQGQVVVPAGTGPHEVEVIGGALVQFVTGTQPIGTALRVDAAIFDETNALVAYSSHHVNQDTAATTKTFQTALPLKASLPAAAVNKTYTWQIRGANVAVNGAALSVLVGGAFPARKMVARIR